MTKIKCTLIDILNFLLPSIKSCKRDPMLLNVAFFHSHYIAIQSEIYFLVKIMESVELTQSELFYYLVALSCYLHPWFFLIKLFSIQQEIRTSQDIPPIARRSLSELFHLHFYISALFPTRAHSSRSFHNKHKTNSQITL